MSIDNGKLRLNNDEITILRNKAISLGLINPRDSGRAAVQRLRKVITSLAFAELKAAS